MEKSKKRNSSFELLRIIAMLMIVANHYRTYGRYFDSTADIGLNTFFLNVFEMFGSPACSLFALITGYFMINVNTKEKYYRRIIPTVLELYFYQFVIFGMVAISGINDIGFMNILELLFPFMHGNWYVAYYIILFFLIPFINPFLKNMEKSTYKKLLFTVIVIYSVLPTIMFRGWKFSEVDFFVVMYLIGAYIRLHVKCNYPNRYNLFISLGFASLSIISVAAVMYLAKLTGSDYVFINSIYLSNYESITSMGFAVFLFLYFSNLKFSNSFVDIVGKATLGVYLIHDNTLLQHPIWRVFWSNFDYFYNPYLHLFLKVLLVFAVCVIIDVMREYTIGRAMNKWLDKHTDSIVEKFKQNRVINKYLREVQ